MFELETVVHQINLPWRVVTSRAGLSTGNVFSALRLGQCSDTAPDHLLAEFTGRGIFHASKRGSLVNDLEEPAFRCLPVLAEIKRDVEVMAQKEEGGICGCAMTGSGAYYAVAPPRREDRSRLTTTSCMMYVVGSALFVLRDVRVPGGSRAVEEALSKHARDLEPVLTSHLVSRNTAGGLGTWY